MSTPEKKEKKRKKRGPTRAFSTHFNDHSGILVLAIGNDPDVDCSAIVWYRNAIFLYDAKEFCYEHRPTDIKVHIQDEHPKFFFEALCQLTNFDDQDNLWDYIPSSYKDKTLLQTIASHKRQLWMEFPNLDEYIAKIYARLRGEIEDYMECYGTWPRRIRTLWRQITGADKPKKSKPKKEATKK